MGQQGSSNIREQLGIFNINDKLTQYKKIGGNIYKEWMTIDYPKILNYKPEGPRGLSLIIDDHDKGILPKCFKYIFVTRNNFLILKMTRNVIILSPASVHV